MPTYLSNGVLIYNSTPHELAFEMDDSTIEIVPKDVLIHIVPKVTLEERTELYDINSVAFEPNEDGQHLINWIRREYPGVVIVGSILAAQAYPGQVVMAVPRRGGINRRGLKDKPVRPDRFTIYPTKEKNNNG